MKWFLVSLILFLNGCSGLPAKMRGDSYSNVHLSVVKTKLAAYKDMSIRWGGTIVSVVNEKDSSQLQVLFYPIGRYGRPLVDRETEGRFAIGSHLFLDPAIYKEGTEVTVVGVLTGEMEQKVGNKILNLPLLVAEHIHIWPDYRRVDDRVYFYPPLYPHYYPYFQHGSYYNYY